MQDFELELILMGSDHSQKVKAPPIRSDYSSKDCVTLSSSTAVSRLNPTLGQQAFGVYNQEAAQNIHTGIMRLLFSTFLGTIG
jgi:hypothetical protein